jgi:hypothetical protein
MRSKQFCLPVVLASATLWVAGTALTWGENEPAPESAPAATSDKPEGGDPAAPNAAGPRTKPGEMGEFVKKGLVWLSEAQHPDGGWGGGSHAHQDVRDPHAVPTDPATTAFVATALLRAGHTPTEGKYKDLVRKATEYLCKSVESSPAEDPKITDVTGTQPQSKLGPLVDTSMTAQYLARVLMRIPKEDKLHARVDKALDVCLQKVQAAQKSDGSWNVGGGWAPVLQSSLACSSLELAQAVGKQVDSKKLDQARDYQKGNFNTETGEVKSGEAAGVQLYALSSSQRANAAEGKAAQDVITEAQAKGVLASGSTITVDNLVTAGCPREQAVKLFDANAALQVQNAAVNSEEVLAGFGNNGGEEFLSYLFTSESLVIQPWDKWNGKMHARLEKIQNADGSWSGHHCITSPVFCTAAVVQCLTTDRDAELLIQIAKNAAKQAGKVAGK